MGHSCPLMAILNGNSKLTGRKPASCGYLFPVTYVRYKLRLAPSPWPSVGNVKLIIDYIDEESGSYSQEVPGLIGCKVLNVCSEDTTPPTSPVLSQKYKVSLQLI